MAAAMSLLSVEMTGKVRNLDIVSKTARFRSKVSHFRNTAGIQISHVWLGRSFGNDHHKLKITGTLSQGWIAERHGKPIGNVAIPGSSQSSGIPSGLGLPSADMLAAMNHTRNIMTSWHSV